MNKLYYGDNLTIMQGMPKGCVDLIYLDPPFNSKKNYNLMYKTLTGKPVPEQVDAFCDTWEMDPEKERVAKMMPVLLREHGIEDYYVQFWRLWIQALRHTQPHLLAYLIYMVQRLLHMKTILKKTGSIYLHCDPTASHYIKVMMDGIFGHNNFRNEIIWKRSHAHSSAKRYGPIHDVILFYTQSNNYTWGDVRQAYDKRYVERYFKFDDGDGRGNYWTGDLTGSGTRNGETGKEWRGFNPTEKGRHWMVPPAELDELDTKKRIFWPPTKGACPKLKRYLSEAKGVALQDIIDDIYGLSTMGSDPKERLGYPTQKPITLLDRLIRASSEEGDVVFDPFCGCGTTIYAAQENNRKWVGCDIAILSIRLITDILKKRYGLTAGEHFEVSGVPVSVEQAKELFKSDPFQFQHWAVERVGGFPTHSKVADKGMDGHIYFETARGMEGMVLSVKGGKIRPTDIRDLRGVLEREKNGTVLAGFISLQEPSKAMRREASEAGIYDYNGVTYERLQLLTISQIVEDKREFHTPGKIGTRAKTGQMHLHLPR